MGCKLTKKEQRGKQLKPAKVKQDVGPDQQNITKKSLDDACREWSRKVQESDKALEENYVEFTKARIEEEKNILEEEKPHLCKIMEQTKNHIKDRRYYFLNKTQTFEYELDMFVQQEENRVLKELLFEKIVAEQEEEMDGEKRKMRVKGEFK